LLGISVIAPTEEIAYYTAKAPFKMPAVPVTSFNDKVFSVQDYGGVVDGKTFNTGVLQKLL
jgi:hypothetical protein